MSDENDVLTVREVAELLRVHYNHVYRLVGRRLIPHRRLGAHIRFSRRAVMDWLAEQT